MSNRTVTAEASAPGFGPWTPNLSDSERRARWRCLAALAMVYAGGSHPLIRAAVAAEDKARLQKRQDALEESIRRARVLLHDWPITDDEIERALPLLRE